MRIAFLIGFQYENERKLPGIATDLYQVYCFLKKHGWEDENIKIMTDIDQDDSTDILKTAILEKIVDSDILTFIEDRKERGQYIRFKSHDYYNNFSSMFIKADYYFVYYTGHSKNENIILPNHSYISLDMFKDNFNADKIFCIMDCCEGGIELPFVLNDSLYRCRDELNKKTFVNSEIICISSSLETEKSITSLSGSFFTRHLFKILDDSSLSLYSILQKIKKLNLKQTANISSSYPTLYYIPGFLYSFFTYSISVHSNYILII